MRLNLPHHHPQENRKTRGKEKGRESFTLESRAIAGERLPQHPTTRFDTFVDFVASDEGAITTMFRKSIALLFLFLGALTLNAQNYSGGVAGTVTDPTGAVIAGAQLSLKHVATEATRTTQSTSSGAYSFETLPVGTYELTAAAPNFGKIKVTGIIVEAGRTANLPLTLKVAAAATITETVTANAVTLDTEETTQTAVIAPEQMASVPLNGRDFTQLLKLVPGYANSANMSGTLNGGRTDSIDFQITV